MAVNNIGRLHEYFQQTLRISSPNLEYEKTFAKEGEDHAPAFTCTMTRGEHTVTSDRRRSKKQAEQDAAALLLKAISTGNTIDTRITAMRGDCILDLMLIEHFKDLPGITTGRLQELIAQYGSNQHLMERYATLVNASPTLPEATGGPTRDATLFEEWIAHVYDEEHGRLANTRDRVFPILGVPMDCKNDK